MIEYDEIERVFHWSLVKDFFYDNNGTVEDEFEGTDSNWVHGSGYSETPDSSLMLKEELGFLKISTRQQKPKILKQRKTHRKRSRIRWEQPNRIFFKDGKKWIRRSHRICCQIENRLRSIGYWEKGAGILSGRRWVVEFMQDSSTGQMFICVSK